jgi:hydroxymethylbilane synthase
MAPLFRIGARGSPLSMTQARRVQSRLAESLGVAPREHDERLPLTPITTTGDRIQDRPLTEAGGKGLFTKELDEALIDRRIDLAVHSAKDLPTRLPDAIALACTPEREDPRDAFFSLKARKLEDLPQGAVLGTSSLRRQAQALYLRGDLKVVSLRGNVETRIRKLDAGEVDATFLALAGLRRLGVEARAAGVVSIDDMPPAAGQGALAITARADDERTLTALAALNNPLVFSAVAVERAFLLELDGSCRTPIAAFGAAIEPDMPEAFDPEEDAGLLLAAPNFRFIGEVLATDGSARFRQVHAVFLPPTDDAARAFGAAIGRALKEEAGDALAEMR